MYVINTTITAAKVTAQEEEEEEIEAFTGLEMWGAMMPLLDMEGDDTIMELYKKMAPTSFFIKKAAKGVLTGIQLWGAVVPMLEEEEEEEDMTEKENDLVLDLYKSVAPVGFLPKANKAVVEGPPMTGLAIWGAVLPLLEEEEEEAIKLYKAVAPSCFFKKTQKKDNNNALTDTAFQEALATAPTTIFTTISLPPQSPKEVYWCHDMAPDALSPTTTTPPPPPHLLHGKSLPPPSKPSLLRSFTNWLEYVFDEYFGITIFFREWYGLSIYWG